MLRGFINIFRNEKGWIKNAFYYRIWLNIVDGKSQFSIQCMSTKDQIVPQLHLMPK